MHSSITISKPLARLAALGVSSCKHGGKNTSMLVSIKQCSKLKKQMAVTVKENNYKIHDNNKI